MHDTPTPFDAADFERQLFASARHDRVPEGSRQRVALALGLAPLGGAAELGTSTSTRSASRLASAGQSKLALLSKSALVGLVGGAVAVGIGIGLRASDVPDAEAPSSTPPAEAAPSIEASASLAPMVKSALETPVTDVAAAPVVERTASRAPRARRAPSERAMRSPAEQRGALPDGASQLLAEVRVLDEARDALAAEQPRQALATLARYSAQFPRGTLSLDAAVLEIRALARAGEATRAHRLAQRTLSRPDSSRYRSELESFAHPLASGSRGARSRH